MSGSFCSPGSRAYDRSCEIYSATARARGCDPDIGTRLPGLLLDAGFERVGVAVVQPAGLVPDGREGDTKAIPALTLENIADAAVVAVVAGRDELERVLAELYRLAADPGTVVSLPRIVQSWGLRPRS